MPAPTTTRSLFTGGLSTLTTLLSLSGSNINNPLRACRRGLVRSGAYLVHRDLAPALGGERLAVPVGPPVSEAEAGEPCHEVELGGPDVAIGRGVLHHTPVDPHPMM